MSFDPELEAWRADWQRSAGIPPDLRRRVERHVAAGRHALWPPLLVTFIMGGGTLAWAWRSGEGTAAQLAAATWVFIGVTWLTSLAIARRVGGRRRPDAETTVAFLVVAIRACRGTRASIAAGAVLYVLFLVFMLWWRFDRESVETVGAYLASGRLIAIAIITGGLGTSATTWYRRLGRELRELLAMQRQIVDG